MARLALALALALCGTALAQDAPLAVKITKPADGARISADSLGPGGSYPVSGTLSGGREPYTVTVGGGRASISPGPRWFRDVKLARGKNTIVVEARDGSGATASKTITVTVGAGSREHGAGQDPRKWPTRPAAKKRCPAPAVGFGRIQGLRVARIACSRAAVIVRSTQRDGGRACTPNRADGAFSRCKASGFRCYSRFRAGTRIQYACVRGRSAARWYQVS